MRVIFSATAVLVLLLSTACTSERPGVDSSPSAVDGNYPEWIERVYPQPGAELSVTQAVQVHHTVVTSERAVRLFVDGVDVTTYADEHTPGLLEYDVDSIAAEAPVELDPGTHEAVAELLDVRPATEEGGLDYEILGVVDSFSWTFTIL